MSNNEQNIQDQIAKNNSAFQIDDAYTLQRDGKDVTYVSGYLLKGSLHQGEGIWQGNTAYPWTIRYHFRRHWAQCSGPNNKCLAPRQKTREIPEKPR